MRLIIGLALLVVVMRQASRPAIYQTFFGNPRVSSVAKHPSSLPQRATVPPKYGTIDPMDRVIAGKLTDQLLPSDQLQWLVALSRWQTGRAAEMVPSTIDTIRLSLNDDERIDTGSVDQGRRAIWLEMLESFERYVAAAGETSPRNREAAPLAAWLAALDEASAARVVDGSIWRSGDFGSFYRYLDQAQWISAQDAVAAGVLPLLQQPDVYRTQIVRVTGGVARAERIEAQENPFGVKEYWQLWLRPSDGADRPLLAIVPDVPPLVAAVDPNSTDREGPQVTMVGRFLKRLAYRSQMGADLAPVVVGRLVMVPVSEADLANTTDIAPDPSEFKRLWLTVVLAIVVGLTTSGIAMWRTAVTARRAREIRRAHRKDPDQYLQRLVEQPPEGDR